MNQYLLHIDTNLWHSLESNFRRNTFEVPAFFFIENDNIVVGGFTFRHTTFLVDLSLCQARHLTVQEYLVLSTRGLLVKTSTNRNVDHRNVDKPKRRHTKTSTNRNVDKPKRRQTETSTNRNVDRPKRRQTETSTNRNVDKPKRRQTITSTDQNVDRPKHR